MELKYVRRVRRGLRVFHAGDIELDGAALSVYSVLPSQSTRLALFHSSPGERNPYAEGHFRRGRAKKTHLHLGEVPDSQTAQKNVYPDKHEKNAADYAEAVRAVPLPLSARVVIGCFLLRKPSRRVRNSNTSRPYRHHLHHETGNLHTIKPITRGLSTP
ncbi:unnamed protein product [Ectocarpus sp. 12 AP-2014]